MSVIKRNGSREEINVEKIRSKISYFTNYIYTLNKVDVDRVTEQVKLGLHDDVSTSELDVYTARRCMELETFEPEYGILAARILVNNHHKNTLTSFKDKMEKLYRRVDDSGKSHPFLNSTFYKFVCTNQRRIESMIDYQRDYLLDTFGFCTLEQQYINKIHGKFVERPQDLFMKEAITLCMNSENFQDESALDEIWLLYDLLSTKKFTYATPTLNNSGMITQQLSSCFVKGTPVFTINRGTVPIEEVQIGDQVATHLGNKQLVSQVHKNLLGNRQVFDVKCYMTPSIQVTENHEMWSISREQLKWGDSPKWNSVHYLRTGDYIAIPEYKGSIEHDLIDIYNETLTETTADVGNNYEIRLIGEDKVARVTLFKRVLNGVQITQEMSTKKMNRFVKVDADFAKFLGIWMGDGHIDVTKRFHNGDWQSVIRGIGITAHADNSKLIDFVVEYADKAFGLSASKNKAKNQNCVKIVISCPLLGMLFNKLFGRFYNGKHLWTKMFDWSRSLIDQFLVGLISTDGCITDSGGIQIALSNEGLTKDIYGMCRRAGILISLKQVSMGKLATCHSYRLQIAKGDPLIAGCYKTYTDNRITRSVSEGKSTLVPYKIIDGKVFVSILRKNPILLSDEHVYTLGVENDHSYNVAGLVAKNCFLLGSEDSLEGINKTLDDAAKISKYGGGIGIHVSNLRSAGQLIRGTNGKSSGIINFLRMYGTGADAYNQGGKRKGSFAIFLRDYHPDFMEFIQLKNPIGDESQRARSLFLCTALSDMFWRAVENDAMWYFVDPEEYKGLDELYGEEFEKVMTNLISLKKFKKQMKARDVLREIMKQQFESGVPYIINIDAINRKNNLKHYSSIRSSNLCVEITLPSSSTEYGVCNLASLVLSSFVTDTPSNGNIELLRQPCYQRKALTNPVFDFSGLSRVVQILTRTMDRVIDRNAYPVKEAMLSNILHRPVGIGCSGLADTCCLLRIPYDSDEGVKLSAYIAETIAFSAYSESSAMAKSLRGKNTLEQQKALTQKIFDIYEESKKYTAIAKTMDKLSRTTDIDQKEYNCLRDERNSYCENPCIDILPLAKQLGVYPSYYYGDGAPISHGEFQWKMWGLDESKLSGMWDWNTLEDHIKRFGIRNSLLTAQMPTATTAQIMSVNEGIEPFTTNIYRRAVLSGEYVVFNKYLIHDLIELGLWNENMKNYLIASGGSIQHIDGIPEELKNLYKTAWDMGQKIGVRHAVARGPFLDHSQSFNVFIGNSTEESKRADKLYKTLHYGWKCGLKTGIYYLRTQPVIQAQQFSIPLESLAKVGEMRKFATSSLVVSEEQGCLLCGT